MSTFAYLGSQTMLKVGDAASPETFTTIDEAVSIGELAQAKDLVEVTHMQSTAKEFIGGLSDGQAIELVCNFVPNSTTQLALLTAASTTSAAKNFKYIYPSTAAGGSKMFTFSAVVMSSAIGPTTPNTAVQIKFSLKISGAITGPTTVA